MIGQPTLVVVSRYQRAQSAIMANPRSLAKKKRNTLLEMVCTSRVTTLTHYFHKLPLVDKKIEVNNNLTTKMSPWKLISVKKASNPRYKFVATFHEPTKTKTKTVAFGARGYEDYTTHHDKQRRERYRKRHMRDLQTRDPTRAGFLSYYILWGDSTSLQRNISTFKKKFKLD